MSNIPLINPDDTSGAHADLFNQIHTTFGVVPNMFKAIGNSSAALESMWTSFGALGNGVLDAKLGEQIAVLIANINRCEYCLAAHTVLGENAGATPTEMSEAQGGKSSDPKTQAVLDFAKKLVENRANVSKSDITILQENGFNDADVAEILAHVALNIFTNYTNIAFDVPLDFPKVSLKAIA